MNSYSNKKLTGNAQSLRRNMTKEERHLWYDFLKSAPFSVKRQKVIGKYIVDFYCPDAKIAIELDGGQHYEDAGREQDRERDAYLENMGIKVLRYSNSDVWRNFDDVCTDILLNLEKSLPLEGKVARRQP